MANENDMLVVRETIAKLYKGEITDEQAVEQLQDPNKLSPDALAQFVVDSFNRGWIERYHLGIDEEGTLI